MPRPGHLIALEGGEGSGKSTQAELLARSLHAEVTREPGGSPAAERIRELLLAPGLGELAPRAELYLLLAARAQHLADLIEPALAAGRDVVVDRFAGSTLAYQAFGRGLPIEEVREACDRASAGRWPDLSVLLEVPIELGSARRAEQAAGRPDRIESAGAEFHGRVLEGFHTLAADDPLRWVVVDGTGAPDEVASNVLAAVRSRLGAGERP